MSDDDREYLRERAEIELKRAQDAACDEARKVHYMLAGHYLDRAERSDMELAVESDRRP